MILLHASHNPDESMQQIMSRVKLKNDHYGELEIFLGSQLQWKNINGSECWTMTSNKYVTEALKTLKITLKEQNKNCHQEHRHHYLTNISLRWMTLLN